jgi:hypothetical protein
MGIDNFTGSLADLRSESTDRLRRDWQRDLVAPPATSADRSKSEPLSDAAEEYLMP